MTRACERLILSGGVDCERLPAPRPGGPPIDWIARALDRRPGRAPLARRPRPSLDRAWDGRPARLRCRLNAPDDGAAAPPALGPAGRPRAGAPGTALPDPPGVARRARRAPAPRAAAALLQRARRLRPLRLPLLPRARARGCRAWRRRRAPPRPASRRPALDPRVRGSLVHRAARGPRLRAARPRPAPEAVRELAGAWGIELGDAEVEDIRALVAAFAGSPLCARLAGARRLRREAPFAFALERGRRRPARQRLPRRRRARARRRRPDRRLQVRPARGRRARRRRRARLRDPAGRLRARRPARRRPARRGRLLLPRAPRRAGHARVHRRRRAARSPSASPAWPAACSRAATRSPRSRTATCAATAPAARAVLVGRGDDAARRCRRRRERQLRLGRGARGRRPGRCVDPDGSSATTSARRNRRTSGAPRLPTQRS